MEVNILDVDENKPVKACILPAELSDMPHPDACWLFNWKKLYQFEDAWVFKLVVRENSENPEGLLLLTLVNGHLVYLNNIEVAPHNMRKGGRYDLVAGCLLAYACYKSFEIGKSPFLGMVAFESKPQLIDLYQKKYGATWVVEKRMFFSPEAGKILMHKYLGLGDPTV